MKRSSPGEPSDAERKAHAYARGHGVSRGLYAVVRVLAVAVLRSWFRVSFTGREHIPDEGPVIVTPNHKNFLDAFFVGLATSRKVRFMAKIELFRGPFGWLFLRLGAFPVRRGEADAEALATARSILADGGLVVVFPEGTRVEHADALGSPHHGAGRLAVETGAPIVPTAITGTSHLWRGALPRLKRVQVAFLEPAAPSAPSQQVTELVDEQVWPAVRDEYDRLRARPGLIVAGLTAVGLGGGWIARRQLRRTRRTRLLGMVEPRKLRRGVERKLRRGVKRTHRRGVKRKRLVEGLRHPT
jgi:1-acyl-sn-glycerol-3-phosphate acyltransferase